MAQVFPRASNTIAWLSLVAGPLLGAFVVWVCLVYTRSSYGTGAGEVLVQPVPFSHQHHVGDLGIDCRYCHTAVERSNYAGMPATEICMNCHSQMWVGSAMLEPVRQSYQTGKSLQWKRIYNLPGFVYFDHSIHIHKGVGCTTCHGRIDEMPMTFQKPSLLMEWCLDCHRDPAPNLREQADIFNVKWEPPADQDRRGRELAERYEIRDTRFLTSCTVCHR